MIEASRDAEEAWVGHVGEVAGATLRSSCSSWYVGANIPGKPRVFMPYIGGLPAYIERCEAVVEGGYEGFAVSLIAQCRPPRRRCAGRRRPGARLWRHRW